MILRIIRLTMMMMMIFFGIIVNRMIPKSEK